ncbi:hypothetical protein G4G28_14195 [Massilia sp. Dwa41.01b]|uniref:hypothetical protein n=1 Tax=Massilia sp. Dwa41.01b TaxID=2709302 RepID=UPI00160465A1|nr:hypothetical protein [Massilia sp. Dwa41.01b]QNA89336.1 hypothetical protein G4G28_14195 [Massilia sp. Dwa41.01b]
MTADVLDGYLDALDPERPVFTQADAGAIDSHRARLRALWRKPAVARLSLSKSAFSTGWRC